MEKGSERGDAVKGVRSDPAFGYGGAPRPVPRSLPALGYSRRPCGTRLAWGAQIIRIRKD